MSKAPEPKKSSFYRKVGLGLYSFHLHLLATDYLVLVHSIIFWSTHEESLPRKYFIYIFSSAHSFTIHISISLEGSEINLTWVS